MLATLNIVANPFHPSQDRVQKRLERKYKVNTLVHKHGIDLSKPVICYHNGDVILRKQWNKTVVKDGDVVSFIYLPQGGGGSNPLRLVLMIGLVAFAPYLANLIAPSLAGTFAGSLLTSGISFLGNQLINALVPPPQPPKNQQMAQMSSPSPTYNIGAQGNQARIGQPIPVLYGKMKVFPDFAAQPYAEYENNEQYLYQLFCVTQGFATILPNEIFVEDSPLTAFTNSYEVEILQPGEVSTLFPSNVYNVSEVSGQELESLTIGPFTANPSTSIVNKLAFDIVLPKGLAYVNDDGGFDPRTVTFRFYAEPINDANMVIGPVLTLATESITAATTTAIRRTYKYNVTAGRYRISAQRIGPKDPNARTSNDVVFSSARAYSVNGITYDGLTLIALKLKATNTISSQSSRKINLLTTRQLPIPSLNAEMTGYNWSTPQQTRSIAWAIADMCRAAYGAGVTEARFDVAQLIALDAIWTARGDTLNCVFDSSQTFWESLSMACRAGRCRPYIQGGLIHFVRDSLQTLPTAMFTSRNIVKNSFKLTYVMPSEDNADCIDVEYFDEVIWKPRVVRAQLDIGSKTKPAKIKAFGVTSREQAFREGMYAAGSNRYRRKEISFETELEGHIPALGDLIGIQSDIPEWGQGGEVVSYSPGQIVSSEPFVWTDGVPHFVLLRRANGSAFGPIEVTQGATPNTILFSPSELTSFVYSGYEKERTYISFGRSGQVIQLARVLSTTPNDRTVRITAINEDARVHSVDGTAIPVDTYQWTLNAPAIRPILADFTITQTGSGTTPSVLLSWQQVAGAGIYVIERSSDNENWETVAEIAGSNYSFLANTGTLYVRIAAFGGVVGPFVTKSILVGEIPPPANVTTGSISVNGQSYGVSWSPVNDSDGYFVEVLNAGFVKRSFATVSTNFEYTLENGISDGGPWRSITVRIYATKGSVKSVTPLTLVGTNAAPAAPTLVVTPGVSSISITVSRCTDLDYAGTRIYASPTQEFTPSPANLIYDGVGAFFLLNTTATRYIRAVHYDTYGTTGLNFSTEYSSTPSASTSGVQPVSVLPDVATASEGDIVYLTTDDNLYTFNGTMWVVAGDVPDGSITYEKLAANAITAEKISAGAVTASKITVGNLAAINANMGNIMAGTITLDNAGYIRGGQTDYNNGSGFWLGYKDTTYKFSIGSSTGNNLTWDGNNLNIAGNLVAGTIAIGTRFAVSATGAVTIKSANTGARLEITNDVVKVFDENGVLRVRLGNLNS